MGDVLTLMEGSDNWIYLCARVEGGCQAGGVSIRDNDLQQWKPEEAARGRGGGCRGCVLNMVYLLYSSPVLPLPGLYLPYSPVTCMVYKASSHSV